MQIAQTVNKMMKIVIGLVYYQSASEVKDKTMKITTTATRISINRYYAYFHEKSMKENVII